MEDYFTLGDQFTISLNFAHSSNATGNASQVMLTNTLFISASDGGTVNDTDNVVM